MPIYEYRCLSCERITEAMQKVGARPLRKCEHCEGKLEKIVSRSAFLLKGGGWFSEGYSSGGGSKPGGSKPKKESSSADAKKGSTKSSDSKKASSA